MSQGPPTSGGGVDPQQQPAVPAGWYPHPTAPGWEAYWDGSGWGTETRPAQPAQAVAPAASEPAAQDPVTQEPAADDPAAQQPVAQDPATPVHDDPATTAHGDPATEQQPAAVPSGHAQAAEVQTSDSPSALPAAAVPVSAAPASEERSDNSMPMVLCLLGAVVAIVGCFLPMASSGVEGVDFTDNTLVAVGYGLAIIAAAVIGAIVAAYCYLKGTRTWLVILLGVVIVAVAAYVGLADLPDVDSLAGAAPATDNLSPDQVEQLEQAIAESGSPIETDASPSTGIFAAAAGGLLMVIGGIGISRRPKS